MLAKCGFRSETAIVTCASVRCAEPGDGGPGWGRGGGGEATFQSSMNGGDSSLRKENNELR